MCARIYSGQSFYEYCLEAIRLRKEGPIFGDIPMNTNFIRKDDKNRTVFEKVGHRCAQSGKCLITLHDLYRVEII